MARSSQSLQPAEYAILGLLLLAPRHGYELASQFAQEGDLGAAVPVGLSDLYAALKRLEARGFIAGQVVVHGQRPPRHVYHLTQTGEEEFRRWLGRPVRRNREVRLDFALKLYFSSRLAWHDTPGLVAAQLAACREQLAQLTSPMPADAGSFARLMRDLRLVATRGTIEWLEQSAAPFARAASGAKRASAATLGSSEETGQAL